MRLVVHVFQLLLDDMGVDLCGGDIGMPQHLLDGAEVCTVLQQMYREGVAQRVGRCLLYTSRCV